MFAGNQFRQAVAQYYQRTPGLGKLYPNKLDGLFEDTRNNLPPTLLENLHVVCITILA